MRKRFLKSQGLDVEVKDAVITVPVYFGTKERQATKEAGELAGLNVLMIMNAPTAAALPFALNKQGKQQTVFVFDLGGYTFDVTILRVNGNEIEMVAADGDASLGGKDWEDALLEYCTGIFKEKHGSDPQDDSQSYQDCYDRVVRGKISLSTKPKVHIQISNLGNRENVQVTREKFEEITTHRLQQCKDTCASVLREANMTWQDIDTTLLVGGSTYMPMIRNLIKEISGKWPPTEVNPDECVAIGAAYQARYESIGQYPPISTKDGKFQYAQEDQASIPAATTEEKCKKEFVIIDNFIQYAKTIDVFENCHDIYDLFGISDKNAPYDEIEKKINEFVNRYQGFMAPKFKHFGFQIPLIGAMAQIILKDHRMEYNQYIEENSPGAKAFFHNFEFLTRNDKILDSKEKENLISHGMELGLRTSTIDTLIEKWKAEYHVVEKENQEPFFSSGPTIPVDMLLNTTWYEILGVPEDTDQSEIECAYKRECAKYFASRDRKSAEPRWLKANHAYECLRDPVKRKKYDASVILHKNASVVSSVKPDEEQKKLIDQSVTLQENNALLKELKTLLERRLQYDTVKEKAFEAFYDDLKREGNSST